MLQRTNVTNRHPSVTLLRKNGVTPRARALPPVGMSRLSRVTNTWVTRDKGSVTRDSDNTLACWPVSPSRSK